MKINSTERRKRKRRGTAQPVKAGPIPATVAGIRRGLRRLGVTQGAAAIGTGQSQGVVSDVLNGKAVSQPCLNRLAAWIAAQLAGKSNGNRAEAG